MALVFVGGTFYQCGRGAAAQERTSQSNSPAVVTVAGTPVSVDEMERGIQSDKSRMMDQMSQPGQPAPALNPGMEVMIAGQSVGTALNRAALQSLALKEGVDFGDEKLKAAAAQEYDQQMEQGKTQLMMQGKLKPGATQADFEAAFKAQTGKTVAEQKAAFFSQVEKILGDPAQKQALIASFAGPMYLEFAKAKVNVSDEDLKASYNSYVVKQVLFRAVPGSKTNPKVQAEKVLSEIKGGLKFEDAMNRYSSDTPMTGKKVSDNTINVSANDLDTVDQYKPLKGLKQGDTTGVVTVPMGLAIYKIDKITSNLPKDFDKEKAKYRETLARKVATDQLTKKLKDFTTGPDVKWGSDGYKVFYDFSKLGEDQSLITDPAKKQAALVAIVDRAKKVIASGQGWEQRPAALTFYGALDQMYNAPGADKAKLSDDRIASIEAVLQGSEDSTLRMELVNLFAEKKQMDKAANALLLAAQSNSDFSGAGQQRFGEIAAKLQMLRGDKTFPNEVAVEIEKAQGSWRDQKIQFDKAQAEEKRREDEERRKAAASQPKPAAKVKPSDVKVKDAPAVSGTGKK